MLMDGQINRWKTGPILHMPGAGTTTTVFTAYGIISLFGGYCLCYMDTTK